MVIDIPSFVAGVARMANGRGLGSDHTEAILLKNAPAAALLSYHGIVNSIVADVAWPVQSRWVASRLIPKASGGERAVGVTPFLYAVVGSCFGNELAH